jgi:hypothetical protein
MWLTLHYSSHSFPWHQYQLSCRQFTAAVISDQSHWLDLRQATSTNMNQLNPIDIWAHPTDLALNRWGDPVPAIQRWEGEKEMKDALGARIWGEHSATAGLTMTYYIISIFVQYVQFCSLFLVVWWTAWIFSLRHDPWCSNILGQEMAESLLWAQDNVPGSFWR